jgi:hypothetical protein
MVTSTILYSTEEVSKERRRSDRPASVSLQPHDCLLPNEALSLSSVVHRRHRRRQSCHRRLGYPHGA